MFTTQSAIDYDALLGKTVKTLNSMKTHRISPRRLTTVPGSSIAGGFGDVEQAKLRISFFGASKRVAVKRLRPSGDRNSRIRVMASLARELSVWIKLNHKNILSLEGFYYDESDLKAAWIATPWQSRGNLLQYLRATKPNANIRLRLAVDTAEGLAYLHHFAPPICHGDLKPENTLIDDNGNALLCDFGLSRIVADNPSGLTTTKTATLTTRYAAPELFYEGSTHTLMSDVWAWGCVLLTIASDIIPYDFCNNDFNLLRVITVDRKPPSDLAGFEISNTIRFLLTQCWQPPTSRIDMRTCTLRLQRALDGPTEEESVVDVPLKKPNLFQTLDRLRKALAHVSSQGVECSCKSAWAPPDGSHYELFEVTGSTLPFSLAKILELNQVDLSIISRASPDSLTLASYSLENATRLWELNISSLLTQAELDWAASSEGTSAELVIFEKEGRRASSTSWSLPPSQTVGAHRPIGNTVIGILGSFVATRLHDVQNCVFDIQSQKLKFIVLGEHDGGIAFADDDRYLVAAAGSRVDIYNLQSFEKAESNLVEEANEDYPNLESRASSHRPFAWAFTQTHSFIINLRTRIHSVDLGGCTAAQFHPDGQALLTTHQMEDRIFLRE